jgi:hypothetical protein
MRSLDEFGIYGLRKYGHRWSMGVQAEEEENDSRQPVPFQLDRGQVNARKELP